MTYIYVILGLFLIAPIRLILLSQYYFAKGILPTQEKALSILRTSRLAWATVIPVGPILVLGMILGSGGNNENPSIGAWLMLTTLVATLLLPFYSLSNTGKLFRAGDYKNLIRVANSPFVGILLLIIHFIVVANLS